MFILDTKSSNYDYIIFDENGKEAFRISKACNKLKDIILYFHLTSDQII